MGDDLLAGVCVVESAVLLNGDTAGMLLGDLQVMPLTSGEAGGFRAATGDGGCRPEDFAFHQDWSWLRVGPQQRHI